MDGLKQHVQVEITRSSSPLDESLHLLKSSLLSTFAERSRNRTASYERTVVIDLAAYGLGPGEARARGSWTDVDIVYPIRLFFSQVLLGPLYRPGQGGPCPECLDLRWHNAHMLEEYRRQRAHRQFVWGHSPWLHAFTLETIKIVSEKLLGQQSSPEGYALGQFYVLDLVTSHVSCHHLLADALCPVCATPRLDNPEAASISLTTRKKSEKHVYHLINSFAIDISEADYLDPVCGVLGAKYAQQYGQMIHVATQGGFWGATYSQPLEMIWSGGGATYRGSRQLALLEGLERYSSIRPRAKTTVVFDSYANLAEEALNPLDCGQVQGTEPLPSPLLHYHPMLKMPWIWGYSFKQERPILVPEHFAYYHPARAAYPIPEAHSTNGCASGSTLEEAILFGLLELIERDGFLLAWYARLAPRRIDATMSHHRPIQHILNSASRLGYDIHLLDLRFDLKIPSIAAIAVTRENHPGKMRIAAKASLDPEQAVLGALEELSIALPLPDLKQNLAAIMQNYTRIFRPEDHARLYMLPEMAAKAAFLYSNPEINPFDTCYAIWQQERPQSLDLRDDVCYSISHVLDHALDVIAVDVTAPEQARLGQKTVKMIAPGLFPLEFGRSCTRGLDLPRLRTVPRLAGYRSDDFDPAEANILPHPFP